jgi:hypothetical protein
MKKNAEIPNEEIPSDHHRPDPGWHLTDKFGDIFVSPDGSAWAVQQSGQRFINVKVNLDPSDIVKTPAMERVKHAQTMRRYRKTKATITSMPNLALSEAEAMNK